MRHPRRAAIPAAQVAVPPCGIGRGHHVPAAIGGEEYLDPRATALQWLDEIGDLVCGERGLQGMRGRRADEPPPQRCRHVVARARRRPREVTEGLAAHHQCHGVHAVRRRDGMRVQAGGWQRGWQGEVEERQCERRLRLKITLAEVRAWRHAENRAPPHCARRVAASAPCWQILFRSH
eukprot:scaffold13145_cov69-Phaeocystis_antarctica.AAC.3